VALILLNQSRFFKQEEENQAVATERAPLVAPDPENRV
jgi:signal peptidase II